jgi:hypothetical protein
MPFKQFQKQMRLERGQFKTEAKKLAATLLQCYKGRASE